jgi:hypothetical protein
MLRKLRIATGLSAALLSVCGCSETFHGPDPIISSHGATVADPNAGGLVSIFFKSAAASYAHTDDPTLAQQMLKDGYALIYSDCDEYFLAAGRTQRALTFSRDLIATLGTLGTGIIAIAHASQDATAIVGKPQAFSYQTVVLYLQDDQNYCTLSKISELVVESARNASLDSVAPSPPANLIGGGGAGGGFAAPPPTPLPYVGGPQPQTPATFQPSQIRVRPLQQ